MVGTHEEWVMRSIRSGYTKTNTIAMRAIKNNIKKVTSNRSLRHFTIIKEDGTKYRTFKMNKEEFQSNEHNTINDWNNFLKFGDYYRI